MAEREREREGEGTRRMWLREKGREGDSERERGTDGERGRERRYLESLR